MNSVVLILVPDEAVRRDLERALRENFVVCQKQDLAEEVRANQAVSDDAEELPLWTWFVSNPR